MPAGISCGIAPDDCLSLFVDWQKYCASGIAESDFPTIPAGCTVNVIIARLKTAKNSDCSRCFLTGPINRSPGFLRANEIRPAVNFGKNSENSEKSKLWVYTTEALHEGSGLPARRAVSPWCAKRRG
jgi:hypothetical protein